MKLPGSIFTLPVQRRTMRHRRLIIITVLCIGLALAAKIYYLWQEQNAIADLTDYASAGNLAGIDSILRKGYDIDSSDSETAVTALMSAVNANKVDTVKFLLDRGASVTTRDRYFGCTPLCQAENPDIIEALLAHGADPNVTPQHGFRTPLHCAAKNGWRSTVLLLLRHGANPLAKDDDGKTPAMEAMCQPVILK